MSPPFSQQARPERAHARPLAVRELHAGSLKGADLSLEGHAEDVPEPGSPGSRNTNPRDREASREGDKGVVQRHACSGQKRVHHVVVMDKTDDIRAGLKILFGRPEDRLAAGT